MIPRKDHLLSIIKNLFILSAVLGLCIVLFFIIFLITNWSFIKWELGFHSKGSKIQIDKNGNIERPEYSKVQPLRNEPDESDQYNSSIGAFDTKVVLDSAIIPMNDPTSLALKYQNIKNVPIKVTEQAVLYENGESKKFWVLDVDKNIYKNIDAKLIYQTPHVYFWVEEGVDFNASDLKKVVDNFEENIYPKNRRIFGSEWLPGVDNDVHLTILYAHHLGGAAGYFSSSDSLMREVERYSNLAEMFYLSADYVDLGDDYASSVLAHEFQHMIHWNIDRNETSWVNEGLSELAVELNGFNTGGFSHLFAYQPDIQLNFWPGNDQGDSTPHYGVSYLFMKYLFERFGEEFISGLTAQPENGMWGLDAILSTAFVSEKLSSLTSENIFQDWSVANYLQTDLVGDGIYQYGNNDVPSFSPTKSITCGSSPESFLVNQFGTNYLEILCEGDYKIIINWEENVQLHSEDAFSGNYYYWSNSGDESAMRLSKEFDLSESTGLVELTYQTWFDIESDYDYLYVNVSRDGKNWDNLLVPSCTKDDPTGSNLGCGYNGKSNGWIEEIVNLSTYTGEKIIVEFEYITDAAVNGEGFFLDDIKMDAVGIFDDFEEEDQGWISEGFVRIDNSIPQIMGVTIIDSDQELKVQKFIPSEGSEFSFSVTQNDRNKADIVVISGFSRYTKIPAQYEISIIQLD